MKRSNDQYNIGYRCILHFRMQQYFLFVDKIYFVVVFIEINNIEKRNDMKDSRENLYFTGNLFSTS